MNFKCKELSISDEPLGCIITFSDTIEKEFYQNHGYDQIIENEVYLMLQRTYTEDDSGKDYFYIEFSNFEKSGKLDDFRIELDRNIFKIEWESYKSEIGIDINQKQFEKLKKALNIIAFNKGQLIINE
ncbi:MAG: hypothetical protein R6U52_11535 [Kosmotogaceae bacterium]